jgi:hypothetical protein
MRIAVCDVCYHGEGVPNGARVIVEAGWNIHTKSGAQKLSLHACDAHKGFFKGVSFPEALAKTNALFANPVAVRKGG